LKATGLPLYLETWKNLDFDNLGKKKTWNLRNFEKKLEKPGIFNKKPGIFNMLCSRISI